MPVRLRLAVHGVRNHRIYHIVAVNQRQRRNAKPIELLGVYNPRIAPGETTKTIELSRDRLRHWISVGASPSKTVTQLLQLANILSPEGRLTTSSPAVPPPEASSQPKAAHP